MSLAIFGFNRCFSAWPPSQKSRSRDFSFAVSQSSALSPFTASDPSSGYLIPSSLPFLLSFFLVLHHQLLPLQSPYPRLAMDAHKSGLSEYEQYVSSCGFFLPFASRDISPGQTAYRRTYARCSVIQDKLAMAANAFSLAGMRRSFCSSLPPVSSSTHTTCSPSTWSSLSSISCSSTNALVLSTRSP